MFGLFRKKTPAVVERYYVYKTKAEKYRQFIAELQLLLSEQRKTAVLYFDRQTKEELEKLFHAVSIDYSEEKSGHTKQVLLKSAEVPAGSLPDSSYIILIADMHSYRSKHKALAEALKDHANITFFTSLDHPLFKAFGSERILALMNQLGMQENERIEHALVTKSIIRAQEKFEAGR